MDSRVESRRDLLFGLLALQTGLLDQRALLNAVNAWSSVKDRSLAEILLAQGALDEPERFLLDELIAVQLRRHSGSLEKSLAALGPVDPQGGLGRIADPDFQATLSYISFARREEGSEVKTPSESGTSASTYSRFRTVRPHAQGGIGEVFVAFDEELNREVALKQLQSRYRDNVEKQDRFLFEAETTGRLEHPGIVPVYGLGFDRAGHPYYAMRLIEGENLRTAGLRFHREYWPSRDLDKFMLGIRQLLSRLVAVCNAIAFAHSRGVLHRDIKPSNIMLGSYGETLVVDWGLARFVSRPDAIAETTGRQTRPSSAPHPESQTGSLVGTPGYMSPEQASGSSERLGPASDVYSLGATLYYTLTGQSPFEGADVGSILEKVRNGIFPEPHLINPAIPPVLERICLTAMALLPEDRFASPLTMAEAIEGWLASDESRLRQSEKLASLGLLSAGVAHEIAQPLSLVDSKLALLENELQSGRPVVSAEYNELLTSARASLRRVESIVQNLRGTSRPLPPEMEAVSVSELFNAALELIRGRVQRQHIVVEVEHTSDVPRLTCVSPQISQVILNLLINAIQAIESAGRTEGGLIRVTTRFRRDFVVLTVSDNGCGISPAHETQLFDPFFTTKSPSEGVGLGLSIAHGVVTSHGGYIEVESRLGHGSSFRVYLPSKQTEKTPA